MREIANKSGVEKFEVSDSIGCKEFMVGVFSNMVASALEEMDNDYNNVKIEIKFNRVGRYIEIPNKYSVISRYDLATEKG
jgi:hypothetical protein